MESSYPGPFEGAPTVKPPALPEDTYFMGLKRLRKKARFQTNLPKSIPQGLKPTLILLHLRHD
jgi:hypothetical protein